MPTQEELIAEFRKETEDLVFAHILNIFLMKHGEETLIAGDNTITFEGYPYDSDDDFVVGIYQAIDADEIDVRGELKITSATKSGFVVTAVRPCVIRWTSARKIPKINFNT
jgi:hypothetical protein